LAPEWFALAARLLVDGEPLIVCARRGDELVAALPLVRQGTILRSLGNDHTPRFDLVGDPAALPLLWQFLRTEPDWAVLRLETVPVTSTLARTLPQLARAAGFLVRVAPAAKSPWFALAGFEERLSAKFRSNLRRRARKLEEVAYERVATYDAAALDEGLALEAAGWKGARGLGTAIACDPRLRRFYHAIARTFAKRRQLTLAFLRARGRRIAFHLALEDARAYYLLKPGFDPAFASFGPGQLLVREAAADAARRGLLEFDFLGWEMDWKLEWTDCVHPHVHILVERSTLRGRLRHAARDVLRTRARTLRRVLRMGA
jgi:CelD/BcsL family acetyltransferase involved in cellulose biosynthesis